MNKKKSEKMFSFVNAVEGDDKGVEGSKILTVTSMFNNKNMAFKILIEVLYSNFSLIKLKP